MPRRIYVKSTLGILESKSEFEGFAGQEFRFWKISDLRIHTNALKPKFRGFYPSK